ARSPQVRRRLPSLSEQCESMIEFYVLPIHASKTERIFLSTWKASSELLPKRQIVSASAKPKVRLVRRWLAQAAPVGLAMVALVRVVQVAKAALRAVRRDKITREN